MTAPYWSDDAVTLYSGDCLGVLPTLPESSVDAVVTDPPYALTELSITLVLEAISAWMRGDREYVPDGPGGFMGRRWDRFVPPPGVWDECMRVLKPGGHLLAFAAPRTYDLMCLSVRIAGFEIRDSIHWIYGSGFSKGINVSKAIDKIASADRPVIGEKTSPDGVTYSARHGDRSGRRAGIAGAPVPVARSSETLTAPGTPEAAQWEGWNSTLKPAHEPIVLARKPLAGTVAGNVLEHGCGALNIEGCRVEGAKRSPGYAESSVGTAHVSGSLENPRRYQNKDTSVGRWPTNVVFSHLPECGPDDTTPCVEGCAVAELDRQSGITPSNARVNKGRGLGYHGGNGERGAWSTNDTGGASRFFPTFRYQAKAPASERPKVNGVAHETVKPLALIQWLTRLITPPGGTVLDPFLGSGTTAEACLLEGFRCIGIEKDERYMPLIKARIGKPLQPGLGIDDLEVS
jgi:site-specific DNA-methyltransferase (adenine-specific)